MGAVAFLFGYILKFVFEICGNYGIAVIIFSVIVKAVLFPFTLKQQKTLKKNQDLQPKVQALQEKYKDNPQKMNEEYQKFIKENNYHPFGGCLLMILQFVFLIGVFYVVSSPVTYMEKLDKETIKAELRPALINQDFSGDEASYIEFVNDFVSKNSGDDTFKKATKDIDVNVENYNETAYLTYYMTTNRYHEIKILNNRYNEGQLDFCGVNLGDITMQNLTNIKLWIFPILTTIFYYLSLWMVSKKQKQAPKMKDADGNEVAMPNMMTMNIMMPLLSGWISVSVPQAMALYWFMNGFLQVIIQFVSDKFIVKDEKNSSNNGVIEAKNVKVQDEDGNVIKDTENAESTENPVKDDSNSNSNGNNKNSSKKKKKK